MKINLSELSYKDKISIDTNVEFDESYLLNSDIKKIQNAHIEGYFFLNEANEYSCNVHITGKMFLLDSVTLDQIPYDFDFIIDDIITDMIENNQNVLDLVEFLWQNIVLEVPIRYTQSDADNLEGDNWKVKSNQEGTVDPRMQKLYDYYKGGE